MVEIRRDPLTNRRVLIAKSRAARPHDFFPEPARRAATRCPFCAGHEQDTPAPVTSYGDPDTNDAWQVRVVPNKYPALTAPSALSVSSDEESALGGLPGLTQVDDVSAGLFAATAGSGLHEVVIEAPHHAVRSQDVSVEQMQWTVLAWRDRLRTHSANCDLAYGLVFKNFGAAGGASIEHAHSQLIATPWIPSTVRTELRRSRRWFQTKGHCLLCTLRQQELETDQRVVAKSEHFVAYCPYASRFPYEVWIQPTTHTPSFETLDDGPSAELAGLLRETLGRVEELPELRGYNCWIHNSPFRGVGSRYYHWHLEIMPRISTLAGFEWGGGDYINLVPPEEAASTLRRMTPRVRSATFRSGKTG